MTLDLEKKLQIYSRSLGSGDAPALLLHCSQGHSGMFRVIASKLSEQFHMVAPDWPGHGKSADWAPDGAYHSQATDIAAGLLKEGSLVIGHSFGATVALRMALEHPGKVKALVLIEPVLFAAARGTPNYDEGLKGQMKLAKILEEDPALAARLFNKAWGGAKWDSFSAEAQALMAQQMRFVVGTGQSLWEDEHNILAPGRLEALTCPVHFIRGAETDGIIECIHAYLASRLPNATETTVPEAGHMVVLSHPQAVVDVAQEAWSAAQNRNND